MSYYPFDKRDVIRMMKEDALLTKAMIAERISIHGTLDYTFFYHYFETLATRLEWLEKML